MLAEKSFQLEALGKTLKWRFVRNAILSIPEYSGLSMSADGLIGLKRNMGCKQRPAVVAGGKAERKLCFLRKCSKIEVQGGIFDLRTLHLTPRVSI